MEDCEAQVLRGQPPWAWGLGLGDWGRGHHLQGMGSAGQGEALLMDSSASDPKKAAIV